MNDWAAKRFWNEVTVGQCTGGFEVLLDGRQVKTPAKAALIVPTQAMAQAMAQEWAAQEDVIDPKSMPFTQSANSAIDKVMTQYSEVADLIAAYGETDLLCYRAEGPDALVARQAAAWDPILDWGYATFGARLVLAQGVMHVAQPANSVAALVGAVRNQSAFALTALHDLVSISGSLLIGLAAVEKAFDLATLWNASQVDENWQIEQWGEDEEATEVSRKRESAFLHAAKFHALGHID